MQVTAGGLVDAAHKALIEAWNLLQAARDPRADRTREATEIVFEVRQELNNAADVEIPDDPEEGS